jgi:hypothetical protein
MFRIRSRRSTPAAKASRLGDYLGTAVQRSLLSPPKYCTGTKISALPRISNELGITVEAHGFSRADQAWKRERL